ncbi:MAG TPA: hypothetical protein VLH86_01075 [Patescibacteria group bacterium]|nr:hypothetical protein [Patescibacteria group bacterium]
MARADQQVLANDLGFLADLRDGAGGGWDAIHASDAAYELNEFRTIMAQLTEQQAEEFSPYARSLYRDEEAPVGRRSRTGMADWLSEAPDTAVEGYLARQQADIAGQESTLERPFGQYRDYFIGWLRHGMQEGWITPTSHSSGRNAFVETLSRAHVRVGEARDTTWRGEESAFDSPNAAVVVAQSLGTTQADRAAEVRDRLHANAYSEMAHVFARSMPNWASHAFAEHISDSVHSTASRMPAQQFTFNPAERHVNSERATGQRTLLHVLAYASPAGRLEGPTVAANFMRAATSNNRSSDSPEYREFIGHIDYAWGVPGAFRQVNEAVAARQTALADEYPGYPPIQYEEWAAVQVSEALRTNPALVFGRNQKTQPHVGAAAVRHARR